jgi:hypothetical protein
MMNLLGQQSTYLSSQETKDKFKQAIKQLTNMKQVKKLINNILENWKEWMETEKENKKEKDEGNRDEKNNKPFKENEKEKERKRKQKQISSKN